MGTITITTTITTTTTITIAGIIIITIITTIIIAGIITTITTITITGIITTITTTITITMTGFHFERRTARRGNLVRVGQLKYDTGPASTARSTSERTIVFIRAGLS
jgi:hypothetical protein